MMLRWLPEALQDIDQLYGFLVTKDPSAAARAVEVIQNGTVLLQDMPEIGRPMDEIYSGGLKLRELYLPFGAGAYVIRYAFEDESVVIVRIWHGREYR